MAHREAEAEGSPKPIRAPPRTTTLRRTRTRSNVFGIEKANYCSASRRCETRSRGEPKCLALAPHRLLARSTRWRSSLRRIRLGGHVRKGESVATVADSKARRTPRRVTEDYKAWLV